MESPKRLFAQYWGAMLCIGFNGRNRMDMMLVWCFIALIPVVVGMFTLHIVKRRTGGE